MYAVAMHRFIHIKSDKFPILPGEKEELVNDGMYGKALAEYLQVKLGERGYDAPFVCCEDWGWWLELKGSPFAFGVCIYSGPEDDGPVEYVCTDGATAPRKWSWSKMRYVDTTPWVEGLHEDLIAISNLDKTGMSGSATTGHPSFCQAIDCWQASNQSIAGPGVIHPGT